MSACYFILRKVAKCKHSLPFLAKSISTAALNYWELLNVLARTSAVGCKSLVFFWMLLNKFTDLVDYISLFLNRQFNSAFAILIEWHTGNTPFPRSRRFDTH